MIETAVRPTVQHIRGKDCIRPCLLTDLTKHLPLRAVDLRDRRRIRAVDELDRDVRVPDHFLKILQSAESRLPREDPQVDDEGRPVGKHVIRRAAVYRDKSLRRPHHRIEGRSQHGCCRFDCRCQELHIGKCKPLIHRYQLRDLPEHHIDRLRDPRRERMILDPDSCFRQFSDCGVPRRRGGMSSLSIGRHPVIGRPLLRDPHHRGFSAQSGNSFGDDGSALIKDKCRSDPVH